jgi:hypothetical protein
MPKTYSVYEVFGVSRDVPPNYAVREKVDAAFVDALTQNKHIVIHGSSKQGKTSLRKYTLADEDYVIVTCSNKWSLRDLHTAILKAAGYVVEGTTTRTTGGDYKIRAEIRGGLKLPFVGELGGSGGTDFGHHEQDTVEGRSLELDPNDVNDIITGLQTASAPKYVVLEDFHYLPEETQKDFAVALKAFHESSEFSFVVVGVWLDENRMTQYNGDLGGRVISINVDKWDESDLKEVVAEGGRLLNVDFDPAFIHAVIENALDSVWIVQEVCKLACESAGVFETQTDLLPVSGDAAALVKQVVDSDSARFNGFLTKFADGFQDTRLEMYRWLLFVVISADPADLEPGIPFAQISRVINDHHPEEKVNLGNITQALSSTANLQVSHIAVKPIVLDYDQTARRLAVVDRTFLVWLRHQDTGDLLELIDLEL